MAQQIWHIEDESGNVRAGELWMLLLAMQCGMITCEGRIVFYEAGTLKAWEGLMEVSASEVVLLSHSEGDKSVLVRNVQGIKADFWASMDRVRRRTIRCVAEESPAEVFAALPASFN